MTIAELIMKTHEPATCAISLGFPGVAVRWT